MRSPAVLSICLSLLFSSFAYADELKDPFEGMYNPKRLMTGALLTQAQVAKIKEIRMPTRDEERAIEKQIGELSDEFEASFTREAPIDEKRFFEIADKMNALNSRLDQLKVRNLVKMRALLSAAQLHQMSETHAKLQEYNRQLEVQNELRKTLEKQKRTLAPTLESEKSH